MNALKYYLAIALLASAPAAVHAQDWNYHPSVSDNFTASLGAFKSSSSFTIKADLGQDLGDEIDFGDSLGVDDNSTLINAQLRWKFGSQRKWSIAGQYFTNDATGDRVLLKDVEWKGLTFREGSFVGAGVKFELIRAFIGRSFVLNEQHDFGIGAGIHNLDIRAFVEGEVAINDETTGFRRGEVGGSQILPNVGTWYKFSPAKRWMFHARVDWISANIGDYDGTMWNTSVGVNFQAWRNVGFDLAWQYFNLNATVDKTDWAGGADLTYSGPVLGITANW